MSSRRPENTPVPAVTARLRRLDRELDQERALLWGAAALGFSGAVLAIAVDRAFATLTAIAVVTVGQYALWGWSPAALLLARLGLRSSREIDGERHALAATLEDPTLPELRPSGAD
ncbi:MAG TPA: hypothetical protein VLX85_11930 [Stellaceae bacterium]|nr:hypothetical protein [Stellaceae bacterium]